MTREELEYEGINIKARADQLFWNTQSLLRKAERLLADYRRITKLPMQTDSPPCLRGGDTGVVFNFSISPPRGGGVPCETGGRGK